MSSKFSTSRADANIDISPANHTVHSYTFSSASTMFLFITVLELRVTLDHITQNGLHLHGSSFNQPLQAEPLVLTSCSLGMLAYVNTAKVDVDFKLYTRAPQE